MLTAIHRAAFLLLQNCRIVVPQNRIPAYHPSGDKPACRERLTTDRLFRGAYNRSRFRSSSLHPILPWDYHTGNGGSVCDRRRLSGPPERGISQTASKLRNHAHFCISSRSFRISPQVPRASGYIACRLLSAPH